MAFGSHQEVIWTDSLLDEWEYVIVREQRREPETAARITSAICEFFADSKVERAEYHWLVPEMPGADHRTSLGLHQLLEDEADEITDEIHAVTGTKRVEQRGHVRLVKGHRGALLWCVRFRNTPRITPMATYVVDPRVTSNPTTRGDSNFTR